MNAIRGFILLVAILTSGVLAYAADLSGTSWRLVEIKSMDDTIDTPDDPDKYTLEFGADGRAAMKADCNRGTGAWSSKSENQLQFGPIASTRAMCPPGSISDKYLALLGSVRSHVIENGHLFLATMAGDKSLEAGFWQYFTDESIHDFMAPGSEDEPRAFTVPPWETGNRAPN